MPRSSCAGTARKRRRRGERRGARAYYRTATKRSRREGPQPLNVLGPRYRQRDGGRKLSLDEVGVERSAILEGLEERRDHGLLELCAAEASRGVARRARSKTAGSWRRRRRWMARIASRSSASGRSTKKISSKRPLRRSSGVFGGRSPVGGGRGGFRRRRLGCRLPARLFRGDPSRSGAGRRRRDGDDRAGHL